jgi:hypothetical protein
MIRLLLAREHTTILSSLCASCPYSPAGCCTSPPRVDLSDIARIVRLGGRDWLVEELAAERLVRHERWLTIQRRKTVPRADGPRVAACVYLGPKGCTLSPDRRAATCNYYVCEEALSQGGAEGARAREVHAGLVQDFTGWDAELQRRVDETFPEGPVFEDPAFLDWLGETFGEMLAEDAR